MTAEQAIAALTRYQLNLFAPACARLPKESWYYCCSSDRTRQGFGPTPLAAIEAAVNCEPVSPETLDTIKQVVEDSKDILDFLE